MYSFNEVIREGLEKVVLQVEKNKASNVNASRDANNSGTFGVAPEML